MNKIALTIAALFSGFLGVTLSFLPQELFQLYNEPTGTFGILSVKLLGLCMIALSAINWMSKERLIGGIYNRPLALANTLHFCIGAVILIKTLMVTFYWSLFILSFFYAVFGVAFFKIMFTTPKQVAKNSEE